MKSVKIKMMIMIILIKDPIVVFIYQMMIPLLKQIIYHKDIKNNHSLK